MSDNLDNSQKFEGLNLPLEMTEEEREIAKTMADESIPFENYSTAKKSNYSLLKAIKKLLKSLTNY